MKTVFRFLGVLGLFDGRTVCWAGLYLPLDAVPAPMFEAIFGENSANANLTG